MSDKKFFVRGDYVGKKVVWTSGFGSNLAQGVEFLREGLSDRQIIAMVQKGVDLCHFGEHAGSEGQLQKFVIDQKQHRARMNTYQRVGLRVKKGFENVQPMTQAKASSKKSRMSSKEILGELLVAFDNDGAKAVAFINAKNVDEWDEADVKVAAKALGLKGRGATADKVFELIKESK